MDIAFALARPYFESGYRLKGDTLPPSLKSLLPNAVVVRPPCRPPFPQRARSARSLPRRSTSMPS